MLPSSDNDSGHSEKFGLEVQALRVGSGPLLQAGSSGTVTVIVGGNNVGKSTLLDQIHTHLATDRYSDPSPQLPVCTELQHRWLGSVDDFKAWLKNHFGAAAGPNGQVINAWAGMGQTSELMQIRQQELVPENFCGLFVSIDDPLGRLNACGQTTAQPIPGEPPAHPYHKLYVSPELRERFEDFARKMFDVPLYFDTLGGSVSYRIGETGMPLPDIHGITTDYADAVRRLPLLDSQGHGMRSALGLILPLLTGAHRIALIDEPEAFLHPPQARLMGHEISELARNRGIQVFVATHDRNVLQGLTETATPVSIIHLSRSGDNTRAKLLQAEDVSELWKDVTLRYGNALDGLFHRAVVVTEADRDSHFYAAAMDAYHASTSTSPTAHNVMFIGSNGKQNMAQIVGRLRGLGVRTVSCPDLDILNDETILRRLVEAHGGDWEQLKAHYRQAIDEFRGQAQRQKKNDVKAVIDQLFDASTEVELDPALSKAVTEAMTVPSKWTKLKESGDRAFRANRTAATALLQGLDDLGIITVRVGVLENFLTTASAAKGAGWLPVAFSEGAHDNHESNEHSRRLLIAAGVISAT